MQVYATSIQRGSSFPRSSSLFLTSYGMILLQKPFIPLSISVVSRKRNHLFKRNLAPVGDPMPFTDEYKETLKSLFGENIGEGSVLTAPLQGVCFDA